MARGVAPLPGGAAAQQHLPAGEPFGRCQARSFRLLPPPDRYSGSSAARSRTSAARSRASARWLRSSAARSRSSAMWSRWSAARSRAARTSWVRSGLRCVGPARSGPPATPVRPPSPRLGCPDPGVVQRLGRDPLPLDVLDELLGDLGQLARRRPHPPRRWWNAWSNVIPSVAATIPLACSIQTRLASACRSWATSTWWLANSTAVRTNSGSPPRTPQRLDLGWRPGPRLGGIHIQGPDRLVGQPHRHAQDPRTCSCRTTTAIRSQTSSLRKSWTATTRSSAKAARHGPSPKSRWTSSNSCIAASVVATHLGWPSSQVKVRPVPSTPTTVLVTSTTRPSGPADPRPQAWPAARPRSVRQVDHPPLSLVFRSS
jgi:hypothetical protein